MRIASSELVHVRHHGLYCWSFTLLLEIYIMLTLFDGRINYILFSFSRINIFCEDSLWCNCGFENLVENLCANMIPARNMRMNGKKNKFHLMTFIGCKKPHTHQKPLHINNLKWKRFFSLSLRRAGPLQNKGKS